jgi:methylthioribose-1-phosphate isomerase
MNINGKHYFSAWFSNDKMERLNYIDQTKLPHQFVIKTISTTKQAAEAISQMHIRGAILIGAFAAFAMVLATHEAMTAEDMDRTLIKPVSN